MRVPTDERLVIYAMVCNAILVMKQKVLPSIMEWVASNSTHQILDQCKRHSNVKSYPLFGMSQFGQFKVNVVSFITKIQKICRVDLRNITFLTTVQPERK